MDTKALNRIPLRDYLATLNVYPVKDRTYYGMYHSPFREDRTASLKVDYNKNLWYDFGTNEGGSMIDLVMKMDNGSVREAILRLEQYAGGMGLYASHERVCPLQVPHGQAPALKVVKVQTLTHPALIDYLRERKINIATAQRHCPEVYYTSGGKVYFAAGFKNDSGGYELRNRYFKGSTSKDISSVLRASRSCLVFEGFMDYLSFLTCRRLTYPQQSILVLNSTGNLDKATGLLSSFPEVYAFLDNDPAGRKALKGLEAVCQTLYDQSPQYMPCKDLNEFLCR
jgi:hypothetical protein